MTSTMLWDALDYAARGWSIIPMKMAAKRPACRWKKYQTECAGDGQLREWFDNGNDHGIAVVFGEVSDNLASRDFDDMEAYEAWAGAHSELAKELPTVETRRGRHVYFQVDPPQRGQNVAGSADRNGRWSIGWPWKRACGPMRFAPSSAVASISRKRRRR